MDAQLGERLVRRFISAIDRRDYSELRNIVASGYVRHSRTAGSPPVESRDDLERAIEREWAAFPDAVRSIDDVVVAGDRVAARIGRVAHQRGSLGTFPATGRRAVSTSIAIFRIADGRIAEAWEEWDSLAVLAQLGHLDRPITRPVASGGTAPEAALLVGLQASGKTTFFVKRFLATHVRISLDLLRTRHREDRLLQTCLATATPFVVDNTNASRAERARFIGPARNAGFRVVAYRLESDVAACLARNALREGAARIPDQGVLATAGRMEPPGADEGFDALFDVRIQQDGYRIEEDGHGIR